MQIEIAMSGINLKAAEKIGGFVSIFEIPEGLRVLVSAQEDVNPALSRILAAHGKILWVHPIRPSLEDFFL